MNVLWSKYVQGIQTLYTSRALRFDDVFAEQYRHFFALDVNRPLRILEVGCGPGALAGALHRWYPDAEVTAIDRDTEFVRFAAAHEPGIRFLEGDATALPFADETFDVAISNTVSEHIEPSRFYEEQWRVLTRGGVCLVLSSRKGTRRCAEEFLPDALEEQFWEKVAALDDTMQRYAVCQYPKDESELPQTMQVYGFSDVTTGYATVDLTPDDPKYSPPMARAMIQSERLGALEALESVAVSLSDAISAREIEEMRSRILERFARRLADYEAGRAHWDTEVLLLQMVRGIKP